jgi:hypothetical protein
VKDVDGQAGVDQRAGAKAQASGKVSAARYGGLRAGIRSQSQTTAAALMRKADLVGQRDRGDEEEGRCGGEDAARPMASGANRMADCRGAPQ